MIPQPPEGTHDASWAERALQRAELRFQTFLEAAPHVVWECDGQGSCVYQGPQWEAQTGQSVTASLGFGWMEMLHPDDRADVAAVWAAAQAGDFYTAEYRLRTPGGDYRWMLARARAVRDAEGSLTAWCGTSTDIHDLRQAKAALEEREQRFRALADRTPIVMWVTDAQGDIDFVNETYCAFFGVTPDQIRAGGWQPLVHPEDGAYVAAFAEALAARRSFQATARVRRADGQWRRIASVGQPRFAPDGTFEGMIGVSPDVTDQHRASELEREAARQKDEFIAVLAHELRNPLAPIRTAVGLLRAAGGSEPTLSRCRDVIDRQVSQMARLLDDLLDVSRLSRGALTLQRSEVRLHEVVALAAETARPLVDQRGHTLTIEPVDAAVVLDADPARLAQILTNLLNNAAKYTNPGGVISVRTDVSEGHVVLRVQDTGIGLASAMRERIFDLFTQLGEARHRADGGLGIGLGLTKRLVEMHGGTIEAESAGLGKGSTFVVTLPMGRRPQAVGNETAGGTTEPAASSVRRRVLVVDDNVDSAELMGLLLETLGCETRLAYDGEAALREAEHFRPEVVLLDLGLPRLDGATVCARLRQEPWGAATVIAAVTGWGQDEDRRRTTASGFDMHLVKPVDPEHLVALVSAVPSRRP